MTGTKKQRVAIIGAGPTGIAAGRELLRRGFADIVVFEKAAAAGGTWQQHSYPGLACDVWAHSYTFSCAPNPEWTASFVFQPEIKNYLQDCARKFGVEPFLRCNTEIVRCEFQAGGQWQLTTAAGEVEQFDAVINAMGNQHTPLQPELPGMHSFAGKSWHSTLWDHSVDLQGKRVVVVGSAASAVQIVPEIAAKASQLTVLQRTPNWILPRGRREYRDWQRQAFRLVPGLMRGLRRLQGFLMSFMHEASMLGSDRMKSFENMGEKHIASKIEDPALREALTPQSRFGCKRPLVSDDFYPALVRDNVELVAEGAASVTASGIVTASGRSIDADIIIWCTGYKVLDFDRIEVLGEGGKSLAKAMEEAPEAYKGVTVPGFPNYFYGVGPNALVLSVSYFLTAECNVSYIADLLQAKVERGAKQISACPQRTKEYNDWLSDRFPGFAWGHASCNSYYKDAAGHSPFLFPGSFKEYQDMKQAIEKDEYLMS